MLGFADPFTSHKHSPKARCLQAYINFAEGEFPHNFMKNYFKFITV